MTLPFTIPSPPGTFLSMNIYSFQKKLALRLLVWGVPSVLIGMAMTLISDGSAHPGLRGFGLEALVWGGIDALIAVYVLLHCWTVGRLQPDEVREVRETIRIRRLLVINARLDVVYIVAGIAITAAFLENRFIFGNGIGVIVQGLFLLFFDRIHAPALPPDAPSWYDPAL